MKTNLFTSLFLSQVVLLTRYSQVYSQTAYSFAIGNLSVNIAGLSTPCFNYTVTVR